METPMFLRDAIYVSNHALDRYRSRIDPDANKETIRAAVRASRRPHKRERAFFRAESANADGNEVGVINVEVGAAFLLSPDDNGWVVKTALRLDHCKAIGKIKKKDKGFGRRDRAS